MSNPVEVTTKISFHEALYAVERFAENEDAGAFCLHDAKRLRRVAALIESMLTETEATL